MADDNLDRLVEKITRQQQPELNANALEIWGQIRNSNLERFAQLKDAIHSALEGLQKRPIKFSLNTTPTSPVPRYLVVPIGPTYRRPKSLLREKRSE